MWYIDIIILVMKWLKDFFIRLLKKDKYSVEHIHSCFDSLLTFIDADKNGYVSLHEIIKSLCGLFRNLKQVEGVNNEKKK